jgi:hypothetical protein
MSVPGVVGTGIGVGDRPGEAAIEVYVKEDTPAVRSAIPATLDGISVRVVETGEIIAQ